MVHFRVDRFLVEGDNPFSAETTAALLTDYQGEYEGVDGLVAATDALEQALANAGYAFHRVVLPPQTLKDGTITLKIVTFTVGMVLVEGNEYFSDDNIRMSVPGLTPGSTPNTKDLGRQLDFANRHPAKNIAVTMRQSETPDAIDATIKVADQRPYKAFAVINNIGTKETKRSRLAVGGQHSNLFNRDHILTLSYTTSPENTSGVKQYGVSYQIPVYVWASRFTGFFSKSDVDTGRVENIFDISGAGQFFGVSMNRVLMKTDHYDHEWTASFQDRLFENDITIAGTNFNLGVDVRSRPATFRYNGEYRGEKFRGGFYAAYTHNLPGGSRNDDDIYAASRFGADASWDAWRAGGNFNYFLPKDWLARAFFDGQYSDEALIAGEQFGLGGMYSIRGFEERVVSGDSALHWTVEMWTPPLPNLAGLRALTFYDFGFRDMHDVQPGEVDSDTLSSAGFGFRWQWKQYLSLLLDYGHSIDRAQLSARTETGKVKWNAQLALQY